MHEKCFISLNRLLNAYNTRRGNLSIERKCKITPFSFHSNNNKNPCLPTHFISIPHSLAEQYPSLTIHLSLQSDEMSNYDKMGGRTHLSNKKRCIFSPLSLEAILFHNLRRSFALFYLSCKRIISRLNLRHPR